MSMRQKAGQCHWSWISRYCNLWANIAVEESTDHPPSLQGPGQAGKDPRPPWQGQAYGYEPHLTAPFSVHHPEAWMSLHFPPSLSGVCCSHPEGYYGNSKTLLW